MNELQRPRILLIEDEENVGSTLMERLIRENHDVTWVKSARQAREAFSGSPFSLALVDVLLPDGNGFDVSAELRAAQPACSIIFLTAMSSADDRIRGLEMGAEDYVVKPFHFRELSLRIKNALKRASDLVSLPENSHTAVIGAATVYFSRFEAVRGRTPVSLTHKECALLRFLYEKRGQVVSRDEILNRVWSEDEFPSSRTVDNFIVRLRRLVEPDPDHPTVIKNVRGVGYQLL